MLCETKQKPWIPMHGPRPGVGSHAVLARVGQISALGRKKMPAAFPHIQDCEFGGFRASTYGQGGFLSFHSLEFDYLRDVRQDTSAQWRAFLEVLKADPEKDFGAGKLYVGNPLKTHNGYLCISYNH